MALSTGTIEYVVQQGTPMGLITSLAKFLAPDTAQGDITDTRVYRKPGSRAQKDNWDRRILELSSGRTISEIKEVMYREEILAGASVADIGLWKSVFCQNVADTIHELPARGDLILRLCAPPKEDRR